MEEKKEDPVVKLIQDTIQKLGRSSGDYFGSPVSGLIANWRSGVQRPSEPDIRFLVEALASRAASLKKGLEDIISELSSRSSAAKSQKNIEGDYFSRWADNLIKKIETIINKP